MQNVTVKKALFGLVPGQSYSGQRTTGGWEVTDAEGDIMMLPDDSVTEIQEELPPQAPVSVSLSEAEEQALETMRNPVENIPAGENIMEQILAGESVPQPVPVPVQQSPGITPQDIEQTAIDLQTKEVRKMLIPPAQPLLREGQCWLSDLTDGRLPSSGVDHIITAYRWDHFPEQIREDIPEFDVHYEWNPDVLENIHLAHKMNTKNLLVGYPGSGKSTAVQQYAALILQPFIKINGKSGIDGSSFLGFMIAGAQGTDFYEGLLPVAMRNGYLLCIDEVFKIPADIQMNFQTVYEEQGFLLLDEKPGTYHDKLIKPDTDFRLMATDNAHGTGDNFDKFGATQVQDDSTLDRFSTTVFVPYLTQAIELRALLNMYPAVEEDSINRFVLAANLVREAYQNSDVSVPMSMRGLKIMCRLWQEGVSEKHAFHMAYTSKLAEDAEIKTVEGFTKTTVRLNDSVPVESPVQKTMLNEDDSNTVSGTKLPWE